MATGSKREKFSQIGYLSVTESAANTLTFAGMSVFSNVLSNQGMIIHSAEYNLGATSFGLMTASDDGISFGLAGSDSLDTIDLADPEVYDFNKIARLDMGTAGSGMVVPSPTKIDFSRLPGGGMLVPADRLYVYIKGTSLASPTSMSMRFRYTIISLSAQDYLELAQTLRVLK